MIAAGNVFLGLAEAPLVIRPYIRNLTPSELHSVMTSGFATVAGGVLAALVFILPTFFTYETTGKEIKFYQGKWLM
jgi:nucleoside permease NupC